MCGIAGIVSIDGTPVRGLKRKLELMLKMIRHRGPDGEGIWTDQDNRVGLAHARLAIIDLSETGAQPMVGPDQSVLVHNGEIYNYLELREELESDWRFSGTSDTETIIAAHAKFGDDAVKKFRGMWAYAHWNARTNRLIANRDPYGIKPFYYAVIDGAFYFASEMKAILPFLDDIETDADAFADYVHFQFPLSDQTMFRNVKQLLPGHSICIENGRIEISQFWLPTYGNAALGRSDEFEAQLRGLVQDSLRLHLRADVPVGAYVSGGVDSSLIAILSAGSSHHNRDFFHGKFTEFSGYDESSFAQIAANEACGTLHQIDITSQDFLDNISKVIYHLDQPIAGPGSFPQYMVSGLCAKHVKVVLGGQGGDEIFAGYTRYLIGYLEQALKSEIMGTADARFAPVGLAALTNNLGMLREYVPLMRTFFAEGLFGPPAERYFRLISRANDLAGEVDLGELPMAGTETRFKQSFDAAGITDNEALNKMTRFDFQWLLPALLQVEDRMGMAHGLESRVPFLDQPIVDFAARLPMEMKIGEGQTKRILRSSFADILPQQLVERRDKMGFPVPIKEWFSGSLSGYLYDVFSSQRAGSRPYLKQKAILAGLDDVGSFSRKLWGLLSVELWYQNFHDQGHLMRKEARNC